MPILNTRASSYDGPINALAEVDPRDDADLPKGPTRGLFVGGAGAVVVRDATGAQATLISASAQYHPLKVVRVMATGTTAAGILALY